MDSEKFRSAPVRYHYLFEYRAASSDFNRAAKRNIGRVIISEERGATARLFSSSATVANKFPPVFNMKYRNGKQNFEKQETEAR